MTFLVIYMTDGGYERVIGPLIEMISTAVLALALASLARAGMSGSSLADDRYPVVL